MRTVRVLAAVACLMLAGITASAQDMNTSRTTYFTFSGSVEVPGATLPAGTYTFKKLDSPSNRHIVQIFSQDGSKIFATLLAIPAERDKPADEPIVTFLETPAGSPAAIKMWFYPGTTIGDEFIYPREQAARLAKATSQPVLTTAAESVEIEAMKTADLQRLGPEGIMTVEGAVKGEGLPPAETPSTTAPASPVVEEPQPVGTSGQVERSELPRTASPMPLVGLIGLLSLFGGVTLRALR